VKLPPNLASGILFNNLLVINFFTLSSLTKIGNFTGFEIISSYISYGSSAFSAKGTPPLINSYNTIPKDHLKNIFLLL